MNEPMVTGTTGNGPVPAINSVPVISYEGSDYRTDFWEGQGREYEDRVERLVLERLLPAQGRRIAEIGAGFGRLGEMYRGYEQVILFDYSRTLLAEAVSRWGNDPRFVFVAGDIYSLPLADGVLDSLVMVRVMHHLADVPQALAQLQRVLHRDSTAVLEYASKRHVKSLLRWALGRQAWSPWSREPLEFVKLNFDFHPAWMNQRLAEAGLRRKRQLAVSHFRLPLLKRRVPPALLANLDGLLFGLGGRYPLSPSVFVQAQRRDGRAAELSTEPKAVVNLFRCPVCQGALVRAGAELARCACGREYARCHQIWDFKEAVVEAEI